MAFIKLHDNNNEEVLVNTDNVTYVRNGYIRFNVADTHDNLDIDYLECDCLYVKETIDEIAEIINNANRPVTVNSNLLQKS